MVPKDAAQMLEKVISAIGIITIYVACVPPVRLRSSFFSAASPLALFPPRGPGPDSLDITPPVNIELPALAIMAATFTRITAAVLERCKNVL